MGNWINENKSVIFVLDVYQVACYQIPAFHLLLAPPSNFIIN